MRRSCLIFSRRVWLHGAAFFIFFIHAFGLITCAQAQSAAQRAVDEAKKYSGTTLTLEWQAGLQALDPLNFSGDRKSVV